MSIAGTPDLEYVSPNPLILRLAVTAPLKPYVEKMPALQSVISECRSRGNYLRSYRNWRGWSFRTWRLERYLANNPDTPSNPSDSGKG
jgi:hypothetical protein